MTYSGCVSLFSAYFAPYCIADWRKPDWIAPFTTGLTRERAGKTAAAGAAYWCGRCHSSVSSPWLSTGH